MPKINIENIITRYVGRLVGEISDSTATPSITITPVPYKQVRSGAGTFTNTFIDEIGLIIDGNKSDKIEQVFATSGVDNGDGTATYTLTPRGILNSETANPPVNAYSSNYKAHSNNALVLIDWTWAIQELNTTFSEASVELSAEAGEDIDENESVSLHTDGKLYLYHKTNYPNAVGVSTNSYTTAQTALYKTFAGRKTGFAGLTVGGLVYAENTGQVTQSSSATTTLIGFADTATSIVLTAVEPSDLKITTKGDLLTYTTEPIRLAVGTNGQILEADSTQPAGVKWVDKQTEFADNVFRVQDNGDVTKELAFEVSSVTTGTTRTITMPDKNITLKDTPVDLAVKTIVDLSGGTQATDNTVISNYTENLDTLNEVSSGVFTVTNTGTYRVSFGGVVQGVNTGDTAGIELRKGSTVLYRALVTLTGGSSVPDTSVSVAGSRILSLTASDTIDLLSDLDAGNTIGEAYINIERIS